MSLFGPFSTFSSDLAEGLTARLLNDWRGRVALDTTQQHQLEKGLSFINLVAPASSRAIDFKRAKKEIVGRIESHQLAALLATPAPKGDLEETWEMLAAHMAIAAIMTAPNSRAGDKESDYQTRIDLALQQVRALASSGEAELLAKFSVSIMNYNTIHDICATYATTKFTKIPAERRLTRIGSLAATVLGVAKSPISYHTDGGQPGFYSFRGQFADCDLDDGEMLEVERTFPANLEGHHGQESETEEETIYDILHVKIEKIKNANRDHKQFVLQKAYKSKTANPSDINILTNHEKHLIIEKALGLLDRDVDDFVRGWEIIASLALGQKMSALRQIPIYEPGDKELKRNSVPYQMFLIAGKHPILAIKSHVSHRPPSFKKAFLNTEGTLHQVHLPDVLGEHIEKYQRNRLFSSVDFDADLRILSDEMGTRPITQKMIAQILRFTMLEAGVDTAIISLIIGETALNCPGQFYLPVHQGDLNDAYCSAIDKIGIGRGNSDTRKNDHHVGSKLAPKLEALKGFYAHCRNHIDSMHIKSLDDLIKFHNRYAAIVATSLCICTGHRPTISPFGDLSKFDFTNKRIFIDDKNIRSVPCARTIPATNIVMAQIRDWCNHVDYMRARLIESVPIHNNKPVSFIGADRQNTVTLLSDPAGGVLLFSLHLDENTNKLSTFPLRPSQTSSELEDIWPMGQRGPRHILRYLANRRNIRSELIDALLGHSAPTQESFHAGSGMSLHDIEELRNFLELYADDIGAVSFRGADRLW